MAEGGITYAIHNALRPHRVASEAIKVLWIEEGSIVVCLELDLPHALALLDLHARRPVAVRRRHLAEQDLVPLVDRERRRVDAERRRGDAARRGRHFFVRCARRSACMERGEEEFARRREINSPRHRP